MVLPDLPKAAGRHPFTSHRRRNQDGDPVATIGYHKPLCHAFKTRKDKCSPRQLDFISQFSTDIRHISGRDNVVADTLSRIEQLDNVVDFVKLANAQESDPELEQILKDGSALQLQKIHVPGTKQTSIATSVHQPKDLLSISLRRQIFNCLHSLSHPGSNATSKLVAERYVWPGIRKIAEIGRENVYNANEPK
ncbi:hypothetical protein EVAR_14769_1 [Eumeta japonica]|uniref:Integrase zinc-binding domain-containing protein n=1 Tax=Eumeta variegata TaxID=151549 RepID=A0A4C1TXN0_EUMVA|nr:hypothetical protein EVAR_14769_1 [Eumeta japonica]